MKPELYDIADILAFEDCGAYMYVASDCSRAYLSSKLACFTRQIVFIRPGTFVIFDRVISKDPCFKKTWLLQAMKVPTKAAEHLIVTNGGGRLFIQTLLPQNPQVKLVSGPDLYRYGGKSYPPQRDTGPAPECRIEISPPQPAAADCFLHVLTAADANTTSVEKAVAEAEDPEVKLSVGDTRITFTKAQVGGNIEISSHRMQFADEIITRPASLSEK
jgi:heparin/heparan-sulfate lyase